MKELKDYIHLYIGCDCIIGDRNWKPETNLNGLAPGIDPEYGKPIMTKVSFHTCEHFVHLTTLILSPLESMSEEEAQEIGWFNSHEQEIEFYKGFNGQLQFEADSMLFLLSKGFDLFGLQAAGLAVYETEVKS